MGFMRFIWYLWNLLDLFTQGDILLKDSELKKFIEYLLIHGLDGINKMFIHTFISLNDLIVFKYSLAIYPAPMTTKFNFLLKYFFIAPHFAKKHFLHLLDSLLFSYIGLNKKSFLLIVVFISPIKILILFF